MEGGSGDQEGGKEQSLVIHLAGYNMNTCEWSGAPHVSSFDCHRVAWGHFKIQWH